MNLEALCEVLNKFISLFCKKCRPKFIRIVSFIATFAINYLYFMVP